jgi:hypothetical protein
MSMLARTHSKNMEMYETKQCYAENSNLSFFLLEFFLAYTRLIIFSVRGDCTCLRVILIIDAFLLWGIDYY